MLMFNGGEGVHELRFYDWFTLSGLLLGMCESVRTRNTLYEVGAAKSKIWHNAVEGRKNEKRENKYKLVK
jgi:hypothetical protein